jgi:hypothetical protein
MTSHVAVCFTRRLLLHRVFSRNVKANYVNIKYIINRQTIKYIFNIVNTYTTGCPLSNYVSLNL